MKAAVVNPMGLDNLNIVEMAEPELGPNEVLLRIDHVSLNFRDLLAVEGGYGKMQRQSNLIPLSDGAGEIVAIGEGVRDWKLGDKAMSIFFPKWQSGPIALNHVMADVGGMNNGVASQYRVFAADALVKLPKSLSTRDAASLPCAAATAWNAVIEKGQVGPGQRVLIQGSGGVSLFALQFAVAAGAEVIATVSSEEKAELALSLGASATVNYREDAEWGKTVKKMTQGEGVHHVVEIGGASTFKQSMLASGLGGAIWSIGVVGGPRTELNIPVLAMSSTKIEGVVAGSRSAAQRMIAAIEHHKIKPVLDNSDFSLDSLKEALLYLKAGKHTGKIVLDVAHP